MSDCTDEKMEKIKEKLSALLFELITDIPESLHSPTENSDEKIKKLIRQAAVKASLVSATLSVPAGSTVNVYVRPDTGYKLDTITSTAGGATSVSGNKGTLTMPAADTTLNITLADAGKKTIYFNNMNTLYAMVSAKYTYNGTTTSNTMTRLSNSNIFIA